MLFTGYADLESIIAAINQGHIFQFMKKPWQPEELQAAVRQAAAEFDRLEAAAHEREHLVAEVGGAQAARDGPRDRSQASSAAAIRSDRMLWSRRRSKSGWGRSDTHS